MMERRRVIMVTLIDYNKPCSCEKNNVILDAYKMTLSCDIDEETECVTLQKITEH